MHIHCFQHVPFEGPGALANWAQSRGHTLSLIPWFSGARPEGDFDALFLMGGPMNIYQYRLYPWLVEEREAVERALAAGKKAVGICLGAQILADVLGGRVTQNRVCEIGWWPIEFTLEARALFPFLPERQTVLHWHGDTFRLPEGAVRLASSSACHEQAFLYEQQVLALQFHLELTPPALEGLIQNSRAELQPGEFVQGEKELRALISQHEPVAQVLLFRWLDTFFSGADLEGTEVS